MSFGHRWKRSQLERANIETGIFLLQLRVSQSATQNKQTKLRTTATEVPSPRTNCALIRKYYIKATKTYARDLRRIVLVVLFGDAGHQKGYLREGEAPRIHRHGTLAGGNPLTGRAEENRQQQELCRG